MKGCRAFSVAGNSCVAKWMHSIGVNSAAVTLSCKTKKSHLACLHAVRDRRSFASSSAPDSGSTVRMAVEALQEQLQKNASEKQCRLHRLRREDGSLAIGTITPQSVVGGRRGRRKNRELYPSPPKLQPTKEHAAIVLLCLS